MKTYPWSRIKEKCVLTSALQASSSKNFGIEILSEEETRLAHLVLRISGAASVFYHLLLQRELSSLEIAMHFLVQGICLNFSFPFSQVGISSEPHLHSHSAWQPFTTK